MDDHGFDEMFVAEVPDYLKCIVCQFVLRRPVQIMKCGHRFCQTCFDRLASLASLSNVQLCCPIDRDVVDLRSTFEDTGLARLVVNLQVKCPHSVLGCPWVGDLRDCATYTESSTYGGNSASKSQSAL